jgi:allantoin racemase
VHITVINPNTTASMTRMIGESARAIVAPGTTVSAVSPDMGPASIESHYDEALSVPGLLTEIARAQAGEPRADGFVIACFGDPGLHAARELADGPVVGIAEAAMHAASFLGRGFSVVTTLGRTMGRAWDLAEAYGMARFCRNVRACEIPVLALEDPASDAFAAIVAESRRAVADDGAEAIVLGCAGMADLAARMTEAVGVPVVDGVAAATKTVESLVAMGLRKGGHGEFAAPLPKAYAGLLADFQIAKPDIC